MKRKQLKKVLKAIDALIDLQDLGLGNQEIAIALERLNRMQVELSE